MQVRHNKLLVEQSLPYCLRELDSAEHPIPYLLHPIYGSQHGSDAVYQGICTYTANDTYGNRPINFEIPKPLRSSTRTLHRLDVLTSAEYHVLAPCVPFARPTPSPLMATLSNAAWDA